jgi:hypothetical protein
MENETILAVTKNVPSSVAVKAIAPDRFLAAWSVDNGTFVVELGEKGAAVGAARRIQKGGNELSIGNSDVGNSLKTFWPQSERSSIFSEDLALACLGDDAAALVMIERPVENTVGGAYAALLSPLSEINPSVIRIGVTGEYANRIAAVKCAQDLIVAWHEGMLDSSGVILARLGIDPLRIEKTSRLTGGNAMSNPSLSPAGSCALIAWTEIIHQDNLTASLVKIAALSPDLEVRAVREVARARFLDPAPQLSRMDDQAGLVFRDDADKDDTPEFYFTLLGPNGKTIFDPKRISQADGWRGPSLIYDAPNFVSAAIRSFQRNLLIGVNRFDKKGEKLGGEFQVYADKTDFTRVDLAASGDTILMIYAEDRRGSGRVLTSQIKCGDLR